MSYNVATDSIKLLWQQSVLQTGALKHLLWCRLCSLILRAGTSEFNLCPGSSILWKSHSQRAASAIVCEHRLTVGKGRVDNSESSFLDLLYLFTKVHREVVMPRFACILKDRSNTHAINLDYRTESGRAFLFNSRTGCINAWKPFYRWH